MTYDNFTAVDLPDVCPFSPDFQERAHAVYRELQAREPVYKVPDENLVLVTRNELVGSILRDTDTFSSKFGQPSDPQAGAAAEERAKILAQGWPYVPTLLTQDPPMAMRYRRTVASHFTRGRMRDLRPHLVEIMRQLVDEVPDGESFDALPAIAVPLPIRSIATVLHL